MCTSPRRFALTREETKQKEGCFRVVLLSSPSLLPHPFVLFWNEQVFASVITAPAKWPARVCAAFQTENKSEETASLRRVTLIVLSSLVSERRCIAGRSPGERRRGEGRWKSAFLVICLKKSSTDELCGFFRISPMWTELAGKSLA